MHALSRALRAALLTIVFASPLAAQGTQKFGYVDTRKILQEAPARAEINTAIENELKGFQVRANKMVDSLNKLVAAFNRDSTTLSPQAKTARIEGIQRYDAQYRDTVQVLEEAAGQRQSALLQPLIEQIRIALEDIRLAEGYTMIFDMGAQVNPIVAFDKNLDLSDRVIARLRTMPAPRPAAASTTAPARPPAGPVAQPSGVTRKP